MSPAKHVLSLVEGAAKIGDNSKQFFQDHLCFPSELGVLCPFDIAQGGESTEPRLGESQVP
jgi:hypothetical protein